MPRSGEKLFRNGIQKCRIAAGYTTASKLSERIGVSKYTIDNWEQGRAFPRPEQIIQLAEALDCSIDALFGYCPTTHGESTIKGVSRAADLKFLERVYDASGVSGKREHLMAFAHMIAGDYAALDMETLISMSQFVSTAMSAVQTRAGRGAGEGDSADVSREGSQIAI